MLLKTRLRWKIDLIKALYTKQFTRKAVAGLFRFIDWVMALPEPFELQFERALKELKEARNMKYVTTLERRAIERVIEQGRPQSLHEALIKALKLRFETSPDERFATLAKLSGLQQLKQLYRQAIIVG